MDHGAGSNADCRERILEAAGEIFAECGFRGATVYLAPGITKRSLFDRGKHPHKELTQQLIF